MVNKSREKLGKFVIVLDESMVIFDKDEDGVGVDGQTDKEGIGFNQMVASDSISDSESVVFVLQESFGMTFCNVKSFFFGLLIEILEAAVVVVTVATSLGLSMMILGAAVVAAIVGEG